HFGTERAPAMAALQRLAAAQAPAVLVLSGDVTQRARKREFDAAAVFVEQLAVPVRLVIPGNHDIPLFDIFTRVFHPYARYQRVFGAELEPVYATADLLVICTRTTRRYRHVEG